MKVIAISAAALLSAGLVAGTAEAQTLEASAAQNVMSGATITGTNSFGNPYSVTFAANGTVAGVAGLNDEFKDTGSWWMDEAKFCRQYSEWFEGKAACFGVSTDGDVVRFHSANGAVVDQARLK
ncbi:MAG: hypothetical protein AAF922_19665 [Pseudomonadota bacterium]